MNEADYWVHLEFRICREMVGVEECRRLGLWCDGLIPDQFVLAGPGPHVRGRAWIGLGPQVQEEWRFTLHLAGAVGEPGEIDWAAMLPADDLTRWLKVDVAGKCIDMDPGAASRDSLLSRVRGRSRTTGALSLGIPDRVRINHDDYHAARVGRLGDGRQFFVTQPFVPRSGDDPGCEYLAVYLFSAAGAFAEARIDSLGPRASLGAEAAHQLLQQRLAELGPLDFADIEVEPFRVLRDGVEFGLIPEPAMEEGAEAADGWTVVVQPGNYMAFHPPWDGDYDT